MNLAADLAATADRQGWTSLPAYHAGDRTWTHGEVHDLAARTAAVLAGHGVGPGDRVLLALPDGVTWVTTFLAVARLGAVAVIVNPELTADEHRFMAEDAKAVLCVSGPELEARFDPAIWLGSDRLSVLTRNSSVAAPQLVRADAPLYVQYTSGTTGRPKGVVHYQGDPEAYHDFVGRAVLGIGPGDVALSVSKLFFAYGFGNAFAFPLFSGSSAVLVEGRPTPGLVTELVSRHGVTVLYSVPSAYAALADETGPDDTAAFASVRAAVTAGEAMPLGLGGRVTGLLGAPVLQQIGSTEAGHAFCANSVDYNMPGTVGRPVPGFEVELRDAAGRPVADGAEGEMWVRGPTVTREYLNLPVETGRTLAGGWLATRDRACRTPDGSYLHLGRADDMEKVGGILMSPQEVENLLRTHSGVRDVAVAAVTDERGATRLRAFVVPSAAESGTNGVRGPNGLDGTNRLDGANGSGGTNGVGRLEGELIALARKHLAAFKVPRTVRIVDHLPRTASGKLRRHVVRQGSW